MLNRIIEYYAKQRGTNEKAFLEQEFKFACITKVKEMRPEIRAEKCPCFWTEAIRAEEPGPTKEPNQTNKKMLQSSYELQPNVLELRASV